MDSQFLNRCQDFYKISQKLTEQKYQESRKYTLCLKRLEDMGRGTVREERGNPVTEVTFKPQGRSPGLNSLTPSTCPHVHTMKHTHT